MMLDHSTMRLGKRPRRHDARTLKLARYVMEELPPAPPAVDYSHGISDFGMMLNDQLGCCTIAAAGHAVQVWTANAAAEVSFPDPIILDYYKAWDGYNPADPSSDQGGVELDVLNAWRQQGFAGQSLDAYVAIDLGARNAGNGTGTKGQGAGENPDSLPAAPTTQRISVLPNLDVMDAIWLFGGAYIGIELPVRAQTQEIWDVEDRVIGSSDHRVIEPAAIADGRLPIDDLPPVENPPSSFVRCRINEPIVRSTDQPIAGSPDDPGSWGGHAVYLVAYDQDTLTCITWGQLKKMTWAWFEKYCSEAYALVSKDWIKATGVSPSGFDLATLENDLKLVTA
jgi:hypothetical protein